MPFPVGVPSLFYSGSEDTVMCSHHSVLYFLGISSDSGVLLFSGVVPDHRTGHPPMVEEERCVSR